MSDVKIVVDLNGFVRETDVVIIEDNNVKEKRRIPVDNISTQLASLAFNYAANKLYLYGSKAYCCPIVEEIDYVAKTHYGYNNLEIEVVTK